jgi:outer membrane protein TolC
MKFKILSCLLLVSGFSAAQGLILTPSEAVAQALLKNYNVSIARNDSLIAKAANTAGNAGMLPSLDLISSGSVQGTSINQRFSNGLEVNTSGVRGNQIGASVNLGWTLFDGGRMFINKNSLNEQESNAGMMLRSQMEQTAFDVLALYFDLLAFQKQMDANNKAIEFAEEQLAIVSKKLELGTASRQELLQVQIDLNNAKASYMALESMFRSSKIDMNRLMGADAETVFEVTEASAPDFSKTLDDLMSRAQGKNISLLLAQSNLRLQEYNEKSLQAGRYPSLMFNSAFNYNRTSSTAGFALFNQSTGPSAGLGLTWNLFNGSRLNSQIKQIKLQTENSKLLLDDTRAQLNAQIRISYLNYTQFREIESLRDLNLSLAEENYKLALDRLRLGSTDILSVKEAGRSFSQAAADLALIQSSRRKAELSLLRLSGELIQ